MAYGGITELHYIAPLANLGSIFDRGILSHNEAEPHKKADVSMEGVQNIRATKQIPAELMGQARKIHDCTNFYFNAKNPMLSVRRKEVESLCVLRLKPGIMSLDGAVISDRNAAVKAASFYKVAEGVNKLARDVLFGKFWTSKYNSEEVNESNKQLRCAELLLPRKVHPSYLGGMYVATEAVKRAVEELFGDKKCPVPITIDSDFFFREGQREPLAPLANALYPEPIDYPLAIEEPIVVIAEAPAEPATVEKSAAVEQKVVDLTQAPTKQAKNILETWLKVQPAKQEPPLALPENMVSIKGGNLLDSQCQTRVNTVNCKGTMGKGIALEFKKRYPDMCTEYAGLCKKGSVKPGVPYIHTLSDGRLILNFPTKNHYKDPSQYPWIKEGLERIKKHYKEWGITSLAIPPLGCGNGKLQWPKVRNMIIKELGGLDIKIELYEPES